MGTEGRERVGGNLDKVDNVVVLMLENRSFDHMLGYLSLRGRRPGIDGLRPGFANEYQGRSYPVHHLGTTALDMDPDHSSSAIDQRMLNCQLPPSSRFHGSLALMRTVYIMLR